jgi:hypothetical protein
MPRLCSKPNEENASLQELQKMFRIGTIETQWRCMGIIMLLTGSNREQVCRSFEITDRTLRNWVFAFNTCGIDGYCAVIKQLIYGMGMRLEWMVIPNPDADGHPKAVSLQWFTMVIIFE